MKQKTFGSGRESSREMGGSGNSRPARTWIFLAVVLLPVSVASSSERYWIVPGGGTFGAPGIPSSNWSATSGGPGGASAPSTSDVANFAYDATYTVELDQSITNQALDIENGDVTLNLNGKSYRTTSSNGISIGSVAGQTGLLTVFSGRLEPNSANQNFRIGTVAGSNGKLTIDHDGRIGVEGMLGVPDPKLTVGDFGHGTFVVQSNGTATLNGLTLAEQVGSIGDAMVSGSLARLYVNTNTSALIGNRGMAVLKLSNRATFVGGPMTLGNMAGSSGTLTVSDPGTQAQTSTMTIGAAGAGALAVKSGGMLTTTGATNLGDQLGGIGSAAVSGVGSSWSATSLMLGRRGTGTLTIDEGAQVSSTGSSTVGGIQGGGANGAGTVLISGIGSKWTAETLDIAVSGTGNVSVLDGAKLVGSTIIGAGHMGNSAANGTMLLKGLAATLEGSAVVAGYGVGSLTIKDGARLRGFNSSAAYVSIGNHAGSNGMALVDGAGSLLDASDLIVGYFGVGELRIENGATVYSNRAGVSDDTYIGYQPQSQGSVTVDGATSEWINRAEIHVGYQGAGSVTIQNGGKITARDLYIGAEPNSAGALVVNGLGSTLISQGDFGFAGGSVAVGSGTLTVINGGQINGVHASIGNNNGSQGTAAVDGPGSKWSSSNNFSISNGTLVVSNGGEVSVGGTMFVTTGGTVRGNGVISGAVSNGGTFSPGTSAGTLQVVGNFLQASIGRLRIEIASDTEFDVLDVTGDLSLDGELHVTLEGGFVASAGDEFDILDWGTKSGQFSSMKLPTLPVGLSWNTPNFYDAGILSVVPTPTGDYNQNGIVDAADYTVWRDSLGRSGPGRAADGDANGIVDALDYDVWKMHFGEITGGGSENAVTHDLAVPEPTGLFLAVVFSVVNCLGRTNRANAACAR